ncbi:esterase/lipase family protein [Bowdeniella nasicola]|uniref:esterase/lipase family protein n=1 Tax=Bowdeniella nasicola TaxID=208480 RepID=UPI0009F9959A|nr:hypothetical protein [Bowdeniella nasicola]
MLRQIADRLRRGATVARDIVSDLRTAAPHWRDWSADYRAFTALRLRAPFDRFIARLAGKEPLARERRHDIIVLPGIYETPTDLRELTRPLRRRGHTIHRVPHLARQLAPMSWLRERVERYLVANDLTSVILLAHSKGGLVGKQVMMGAEGHRIAGMVALATPWQGSRYASLFWPGLGVRSLRPGSAMISAAMSPHESDARIVSIQPSFDPHVPQHAHLPGAHQIDLTRPGHFAILSDRDVIATVANAVDFFGA